MYGDLIILCLSEFSFCEKKDVTPPFFKKTQLFVICPAICPVICLVIRLDICSVIRPVIRPVIWCFPIWLTSSLSYPMAIFSANEIRTFIFYLHAHRNWLFPLTRHISHQPPMHLKKKWFYYCRVPNLKPLSSSRAFFRNLQSTKNFSREKERKKGVSLVVASF